MGEQSSSASAAGASPARPAVQWEAPAADRGPAPGIEWAGYGARFIAYLIDGFVLGVVLIVLSIVFVVAIAAGAASGSSGDGAAAAAAGIGLLWILLIFGASLLYFPWFWSHGGQTPGMRPFGIRVVSDRDGGPVSWGSAFIRLIGFWVSSAAMYLGFVWIFIDRRRRGWHDLFAGTVVIRDPNR